MGNPLTGCTSAQGGTGCAPWHCPLGRNSESYCVFLPPSEMEGQPKSGSLLLTTFRERNGPRPKAPFHHRYINGHWIGQKRTENKTQLERSSHCTLLQLKASALPPPPRRDIGKGILSAGSTVSWGLPESLNYTLVLRPKEQGTTAGRKRLILLETGTCSHCGPHQPCLHRWTSNKVWWQTNRQKTTNQTKTPEATE